jgi:NADPH:quinone reductase-like Zn-dependent oxidoreductase
VQIAKARGAYVIGTASRGKHDLLHDLGIDEAVDYRAEAFERAIEPVDVVYDHRRRRRARSSTCCTPTAG